MAFVFRNPFHAYMHWLSSEEELVQELEAIRRDMRRHELNAAQYSNPRDPQPLRTSHELSLMRDLQFRETKLVKKLEHARKEIKILTENHSEIFANLNEIMAQHGIDKFPKE